MKVLVLLIFFGMPGHHVTNLVKFSTKATLKECQATGEKIVNNLHAKYPNFAVGYLCGFSNVKVGLSL